MARSRKKTISQRAVSMAAAGMPEPVKSIVASRWGARLIVLALPLLLLAGVFTVEWSNGWPKFSFNRQRAGQIKVAAQERLEQLRQQAPGDPASESWLQPTSLPGIPAPAGSSETTNSNSRSANLLRIASFNIQVFGTSKAEKPHVMDVLARVVRRFDVVAIQELRTTEAWVLENFLALINQGTGTYRYVVGPRLGRTASKEQYVFVYDAARVDIDPQSVITIVDPQDLLHREPLIARFHTRTTPPGYGFSFILVNIHTDPDETDQELDALGDVFAYVQRNYWGEDDVILLGDLNVSYKNLGKLGALPGILCTVQGEPTNTRGTKSYDNIVFQRDATSEFAGRAGVMSLQQDFGLTTEQALQVSDHQPVWAEFQASEAGGQSFVAALPDASVPGGPPSGTNQPGRRPLFRWRGER